MPRFFWPGHEMQLLGGLQKLQKSNEFCDALLQTEGISVPTHSCVLAALSPYLSEKLSASPSPPSGQRHQVQVQLHALKAQTLLKLVGLLYSGELEVKGSVEQNDVLAAAHQFGIANLVEGQKDGGMSQWSCGENGFCAQGSKGRHERRRMKDAQVQAEMAERRETDSLGEKRSCVSTGTQTVTAGEKSAASSVTPSSQAPPATPESTPSGAQTSMHNGASSEGEPTSNQPFGSLTNSSLEFGDSVQVLSEEWTELENKQRDNSDDREQLVQANGDETAAADRQKSTEKEHGDVSVGITQATQISVKVKLRRKTEGETWEVVNIQDSDETSALASVRQDDCHHKRPDKGLSTSLPPPSTHGPDCHILQPHKSPPHLNTSPDPQPPSGESVTPNQTSGLEAAPPLQHQCPVEDSDEQIEKLLEDIMMGLNILPALDRDSNKSQFLQQSHSRVQTVPRVPGPQNDMGHSQIATGLNSAGCVQYQDLETHSDKSSADKAQNQLSCPSLSSMVPAGVLQLQQQECFPQNHSSIRSMWQMDGMSQQSAPLLKSQECLRPEPPTIRSVTPGALFSTGQKLHYPALHEASSLDNQHMIQFLPLSNETYSHTLYLPCMDDLRLPRCLSPLDTFTSSTKYQLAPNISTKFGMKNQQKPSRHAPPWLTENPGSLHSSLSAVSHGENKSASLPQDTTWCSWPKQWQENQVLNPKSCVAKGAEEGPTLSASQQNASGLKSDRGRMRKGDTTLDAVAPKRRKRTHPSKPQDAAGSVLAYKGVRVSDAINSHINLSICQVSLSSNNVLAKKREMTNSSLKSQSESVEAQNQPSSITESLGEKSRRCRMNTGLTQIRTRGFMEKAQELNDLSPGMYSFAKPVAHCVKMVNKEGVRKRKCGRPPKKQHGGPAPPKSHPSVFEKKNHSEENQQKTDNSLTKEELENKDKTRTRCKRRRISRNTDLGVIALKSTTSVESTGKSDGKVEIVKRSQMVTLKDFKNLIKRQHWKMRESNKSQETNETGRDGQNESQGTVDKNHNLISSQLTGGMKRMLQDNKDSSTWKETGLIGGNPSVFTFDVLEEDLAKIAAEREQPLKSADEGTTCNTAESDRAQKTVIGDEGLSRSDTHLPQENKLPSHPILHPQSPLEDAGGSSRTLSCNEEEEEVEVEVDVLLYSPVKVPQTGECEDGLENIELSPDDEEDEDVIDEIDVTGDESQ